MGIDNAWVNPCYTVTTDNEEPEMTSNYYPDWMTQEEIAQFREELEFYLDQEADPLYNVNMELTLIGGYND